jgi:hypothetical protein
LGELKNFGLFVLVGVAVGFALYLYDSQVAPAVNKAVAA